MKKDSLKYAFLNEDPRTELAVAPDHAQTVVCIAGSGFRVLPLLGLKNLKKIYIIDHSEIQLDNTKKLLVHLKENSYDQFIQKIRPLSPESTLYSGKHEKVFVQRARLMRWFFGKNLQNINKHKRWPLFVKLYALFLNLVVRHKSISSKQYCDFLEKSYSKLLRTPYAENFFLQQFLTGYAQSLEAFKKIIPMDSWTAARNHLNAIEIVYIHKNVLDFLNSQIEQIDFISLSNVTNYMDKQEIGILQKNILQALKPRGRVVVRSFIEKINLPSLKVNSDFDSILDHEMTGSYEIKVYEKY